MTSCHGSYECVEHTDKNDLIVDASQKDFDRRWLTKGVLYEEGTLLMANPDPALLPWVKWDGDPTNPIKGITFCDVDLTLAEQDCSVDVLVDGCVDPVCVCWPEALESDAQIYKIMQDTTCCLRFVGRWDGCVPNGTETEELPPKRVTKPDPDDETGEEGDQGDTEEPSLKASEFSAPNQKTSKSTGQNRSKRSGSN